MVLGPYRVLRQVPVPGRSSGLWFALLPAPSHLVERNPLTVIRESQERILRFTLNDSIHVRKDSGVGGFRPHSQRRDREGVAPSSLTRKS